jgi:hypothetical protein
MHVAVGRVSFDPSRDEEARAGLREMVIPRVKEAPGSWRHIGGMRPTATA